MKKKIYILAFIFLGFQIQFLIHSFVEQNYIYFLLKDFDTFSFGMTWAEIYAVHHILTIFLLVAGVSLGYWQGKYWWKYIYLDKRLEYKWKDRNSLLWKILKY